MTPTEIKPAELKMKTDEIRLEIGLIVDEVTGKMSFNHVGDKVNYQHEIELRILQIIDRIQQDAIRSVQPAEGLSDKEMLDWLEKENHADFLHCDAEVGFYIEGFHMETFDTIRQAITAAIKKEREG